MQIHELSGSPMESFSSINLVQRAAVMALGSKNYCRFECNKGIQCEKYGNGKASNGCQ